MSSPQTHNASSARWWPPRERTSQVMMLALPIIGGMLSQNVMNLIDTGMVAQLGDNALAGVGMGSFANFMSAAFIMGISVGVQAIAGRRLGEGRDHETAVGLNGGLLLALGLGIPTALVLFLLTPTFFPYLVADPKVIAVGVPYFQARLFALPGVGMNFAFRGYWNGVNRSGLYMRTIIVMHVANIFFNWIFIFGNLGMPAYGATGAGIATAIATYIGTLYYIWQGFRYARPAGFFQSMPDKETFLSTLRLAIPNGMQQFFFAAGMTVFFWILGKVGTRELAASNVLVTLMLVGLLPSIGFGLVTTSLVSQSLGRRDPDEAMRWGWDISKIAGVLLFVVALPSIFFPDLLLSPFLKDPKTLALARVPLQLLAVTLFIEAIGRVFMHALLGAGDNQRVMFWSIFLQWGLFLPCAYVAGPVLRWGMLAIWFGQIVYRILLTLVYGIFWRGGAWQKIQI